MQFLLHNYLTKNPTLHFLDPVQFLLQVLYVTKFVNIYLPKLSQQAFNDSYNSSTMDKHKQKTHVKIYMLKKYIQSKPYKWKHSFKKYIKLEKHT